MSDRRPLFRGSELPRLLILAVVALAGWSTFALMDRSGAAPQAAPPAPVAAAAITPVRPDTGIEFQALVDKAPIQVRESAAYAILLDRARRTPPAELARQGRRDLFWTHFWERPNLYRGVPVHLEGTALRVLSYEVNPALTPSGRIYEAWIYSDENRAFPYVVTLDEPPPGLVVGPDLHLRVRFDGYFLKLLGYRAGDKWRAAPLLVGRLALPPAAAPPPAPMVEVREFFRRNGVVTLLALLFGYIGLRGFFQVRRLLAPGHRSPASSGRDRHPVATEVAPEDLSHWLANLPDSEPDPEDDPPRPPA